MLVGIIGIFTIGSNFAIQIYHAYWGNQDIWWTPRTMQLGLEETKDNFKLYISNKSLQQHLTDGNLFILDNDGGQYRIVSKDVTVRLNNWYKVKSSILENAIISGVAFGIIITVLVIGLIQVCRRKKRFANLYMASACQENNIPIDRKSTKN